MPGVVGVPVIAPVFGSTVSPGGTVPPATVHVPGRIELSVVVYSPPDVPPGTGALDVSTPAAAGCVTPASASGVFTACATATGVTLSAARNVIASVLTGSYTRSVIRAVSPGAMTIVRFSRSGFSRSGFASSPVVTNLGFGMLARSIVCDCFSSEQPSVAGVW